MDVNLRAVHQNLVIARRVVSELEEAERNLLYPTKGSKGRVVDIPADTYVRSAPIGVLMEEERTLG